MFLKWEVPFFYIPPGSDFKKDWFVWFKYRHPITGKMERFRYKYGFNQHKSKSHRRAHGAALKQAFEDLLNDGWTPYEEYYPIRNSYNRTISHCIDLYLVEAEPNLRPNTYGKYKGELTLFKDWRINNGYGGLHIREVRKNVVTTFFRPLPARKGLER